jgi:aryl-alcohol dehydrogenase-like predicted oxidoreductase
MECRALGHTGVSASQIWLGAMMFGAFGNADHKNAVRLIQSAELRFATSLGNRQVQPAVDHGA